MFLSPSELERLTGYSPNQRRRICRWLDEHGYPYTVNRLGDPVVLRKSVESGDDSASTPNLDWLKVV